MLRPDVDAHVEILQTLADKYLAQGDKLIPAKLLTLGRSVQGRDDHVWLRLCCEKAIFAYIYI